MSDFFGIGSFTKQLFSPLGAPRTEPAPTEKSPETVEPETPASVSGVVDQVTLLGDKVGQAAEGFTKFAGGVTAIGAKSSTILSNTALNFVGIEGEDAKEASKWIGGFSMLKLPIAASAAGIGVASWVALKAFGVEPDKKDEKPTLLGTYAREVNEAYSSGGSSASKIVRTLSSKVKAGVSKLKSTGDKVKKAEATVEKVSGRLAEIAGDISGEQSEKSAEDAAA